MPRQGARSIPNIATRSSTASVPIVLAKYVSVEDGTGLVHTAPGTVPRTTRPADAIGFRS